MSEHPTIFVSHGAPTLALEESPTVDFLRALPATFPRPRAIVVASAHYTVHGVEVGAHPTPDTVHDFGGFPAPLYALRYPAPGDPALAARMVDLLVAAGIDAHVALRQGLDHGVWVPLRHMYPEADIPVLPLSVDASRDARFHLAVGMALAPLREQGVLVIGSGGFVHNLGALDWKHPENTTPSPWAEQFADWLRARIESGDAATATQWLALAPDARTAHPTPEHLLPLFVAWGAAGPDANGRLLRGDWEYGSLGMHGFRFD